MPSIHEMRSIQKGTLHSYKKLKAASPENKDKILDDLINRLETEMEEEDVALVEKKIAQLYDKK